jgi:hypothetical protein
VASRGGSRILKRTSLCSRKMKGSKWSSEDVVTTLRITCQIRSQSTRRKWSSTSSNAQLSRPLLMEETIDTKPSCFAHSLSTSVKRLIYGHSTAAETICTGNDTTSHIAQSRGIWRGKGVIRARLASSGPPKAFFASCC